MIPVAAFAERFRADLDDLIGSNCRLGLAVSGGPDSLALLLLATSARPDQVAAATVDHGLRADSRREADHVAAICKELGVPHTTLVVQWDEHPRSAIQERARQQRYGAIAGWMRERSLGAVLTGHHLDDQVETLLMRLNRGSGVRGLGGMRAAGPLPTAADLSLLRPLLGWRRSELEQICADAGVQPCWDPSNVDTQFERVRIRRAIAQAAWLDPQALARSASHLALADEALDWVVGEEWRRCIDQGDEEITYRRSNEPAEIRRRIVARAIRELGTEGPANELRGRELDRLLKELESGGTATLRGVRCTGGTEWRFTSAPRRGR